MGLCEKYKKHCVFDGSDHATSVFTRCGHAPNLPPVVYQAMSVLGHTQLTEPPHAATQVPIYAGRFLLPQTRYRYMVPGTRYLVPGTRYLVPGTRYQVPSIWCQVPGTKYLIPGARYLVGNRIQSGTQMEPKWNANGTQMERKWNANGTQMEHLMSYHLMRHMQD